MVARCPRIERVVDPFTGTGPCSPPSQGTFQHRCPEVLPRGELTSSLLTQLTPNNPASGVLRFLCPVSCPVPNSFGSELKKSLQIEQADAGTRTRDPLITRHAEARGCVGQVWGVRLPYGFHGARLSCTQPVRRTRETNSGTMSARRSRSSVAVSGGRESAAACSAMAT